MTRPGAALCGPRGDESRGWPRHSFLPKKRGSIASSSKIGSINETSSSCRCRAVLVVRSIAVSQEGCRWDGRVVANLKPTPAGVPEMPEEPFFKRRIGFEFLFLTRRTQRTQSRRTFLYEQKRCAYFSAGPAAPRDKESPRNHEDYNPRFTHMSNVPAVASPIDVSAAVR